MSIFFSLATYQTKRAEKAACQLKGRTNSSFYIHSLSLNMYIMNICNMFIASAATILYNSTAKGERNTWGHLVKIQATKSCPELSAYSQPRY